MVVDAEARFRQLFRVAYPAIGRYARNRGLRPSEAEDLVARTLEIGWRRLSDVPADDPLPWLYAVARNLLRNERRSAARHNALVIDLAAAGARPAADDDGTSLDARALREALAGLGEDDQELLRLIAWDGLSPAQAATTLGCSPEAARTRLHRARKRLAARLAGTQDTEQAIAATRMGDSDDDPMRAAEVSDA